MTTQNIDRIPAILKKLIKTIMDIATIIIAYMLTNVFSENIVSYFCMPFVKTWMISCIIYIAMFYVCGVYRSATRYLSVREYIKIGIVSFGSLILLLILNAIFSFGLVGTKRIMLAWILIAVGCVCNRVAMYLIIAYIFDYKNKVKKQNVLIIGAGEATTLIIREIKQHMREYKIVGLIDDSSNKKKNIIYGTSVLRYKKRYKKNC